MHTPEQNVLDYKSQKAARDAPFIGMALTAMTGVFGSFLWSTMAIRFFIGKYTANFFPGYVSLKIGSIPLYSPYALYKAYMAYYQYPMMQHTFFTAATVIVVTTLAVATWQFITIGRKQEAIYKTDLHGSAHWAVPKEVAQMALLPDGKSRQSRRICYVGGYPDANGRLRYLQHAGAEHIIAFAPTRSGKGVGLVLPTLLGGWRESVVVHDIKGENYLLTAGYRRAIGQQVLKFNPGFGLDGDEDVGDQKAQCCHFNPLEEVRIGTQFEVKDVMNIATMIVDPDGKGLNDHWQKTGFALLTSVILHVLYAEPDKTLRGVAAFLNDPELTEVNDAFNKMMAVEHDPDERFKWKDQRGEVVKTHPVIAQSAKEMLNKAENEQSGVISTMMSFLSLYRDPIVAEWTEYSDFHILDLQDSDEPVSLYLVTSPEDKNRLKPLIRLVLNLIASKFTAANRLIEKGGRMESIAKHPLMLLLDEFPSLGKMDMFQDTIAFLAGYLVKLMLIAQDKSQLEDEGHAYGKSGAQAIINNCHIRVIYAPNEITTAEWVSKMLGKKTVAMENTNQSFEGGFIPAQKGQSRSVSYQGRDLLTADEVLRLRGPEKRGSDIVKAGDMLILVAGFAPVYGQQMLYFKDPVFLKRAQIAAPSQGDITSAPKDYRKVFGESCGVLTAPIKQEDLLPDLSELEDEMPQPPAGNNPVRMSVPQGTEDDESSDTSGLVDTTETRTVAELLASMPLEIQETLAARERTARQKDRAGDKDDLKGLLPGVAPGTGGEEE
ncbi:type IV secretory system conjugative DNA transfer family protein [Acidithiobacillus sp.]|uniref:type IV secretory system conjugative DNA transfer family protein n=1 Tax=Acidithiobacillus sp. TaxID=1872118 RepID=UPI003D03E58B